MNPIEEIYERTSIFLQEVKIKALDVWIKLLEGKNKTEGK